MSDVVLFHSLPDLYRSLGIELKGSPGFTIHRIEDIHQSALVSPVFRVNYYSFLFIRSGRGRYLVDGTWYEVGAGTVYFTNPGHLKAFANDQPYTGYLISFSEAFLKRNGHTRFLEAFPFLIAEVVPPLHPTNAQLDEFDEFLSLLYRQSLDSATPEPVVAALWVSLLHKLGPLVALPATGPSPIVHGFLTFLEATFRHLETRSSLPNVEECAAALGLHPGYLQTVIKAKTGKTPLAWIAEKTLAEAETLLRSTNLSIKEISSSLKFPDATLFARYCRRHWGEGPRARRLKK